jgi:hypothetical protein
MPAGMARFLIAPKRPLPATKYPFPYPILLLERLRLQKPLIEMHRQPRVFEINRMSDPEAQETRLPGATSAQAAKCHAETP